MNKLLLKFYIMFLFLLTQYSGLYGQDSLQVRGQVLSVKHIPLSNVSVSVEGTDNIPQYTDEQGAFSIKVKTGSEWLIIQAIAKYKSKRVFINGRTEVNISLTEKEIYSGYDPISVLHQTVPGRDIPASWNGIEMKTFHQQNLNTIQQAFQGAVPGMFVTNHSGMPGQGAMSYIRGIRSMHGSNSPLYIVDGIPLEAPGLFESKIEGNVYDPLSLINPNDVSMVTVFKDFSATSIYGSKASNGVVFIQTLKPQATQTSIKVLMEGGVNLPSVHFIPQLNPEQYKSLANEILVSSPLKEETFGEIYPGLYIGKKDDSFSRYMHNTNWQNEIYAPSLLSNFYCSVKGGSEIATYGLSVGYRNQGGIIPNTHFDRFNVRFVSHLNLFKRFNMDVNASLVNSNSNLNESAESPQTNPVLTSLSKAPMMNPFRYDEENRQLLIFDDIDELGTSNPVVVTEKFIGENKNYRFLSSVKGQADLSSNLQLNTLLGLNFNNMKESVFMPNKGMESYYNGEVYNVSQSSNNYLFSIYTDNYVGYNKQIRGIHDLSASVGIRIHTSSFQVDFGEARNLPENDEFMELNDGEDVLDRLGGENSRWNALTVYNSIGYKFRDKFILNAGMSADFSTRIGIEAPTSFQLMDMPFGLFYSVGAGWRISQESIFKRFAGLENLLIRTSYGLTGNDDIGDYSALSYYQITRYRETSGLVRGSIVNQSLIYENTSQFNVGIDLSLWGDRTRVTTDFYLMNTEDVLIYEPQSGYMGYSYKLTNAGAVKNSGWEIAIFQRFLESKVFTWDLSFNTSYLFNEVTDVGGHELINDFEGGQFVTRKGDPVNSFYGYRFEGVFATQEEANIASLRNQKGIPYGAGDAIYADVSGPGEEPDGIINEYDRVFLGSPIPEIFGSLSSQFQYKSWSIGIMLQFAYKNEVYNHVRYMNERMTGLSNQSTHVLKRWQFEGDQTEVPRALWNDPVGNSDFSSRWIEDGSYIRIKHLRLGYRVEGELFFFKNVEFYLTATNLFKLDNYLGYDPEFSCSFDVYKQGIDYGLMPQFRQFLVGVQMGL